MRAVIADPDLSERATLVDLCYSHGGLDNLIVVESGTEALKQIRVNRPDVVLLTCELEEMTGFDVLGALDEEARPAAIMIAPDNRYAAEARCFAATEYLTRPISGDRLALALERACSRVRRGILHATFQKASAPDRMPAPVQFGHHDRLVAERGGRMFFFSPLEIDYITADSPYVQIHVGTECYINRDSLTRLSRLLESIGFIRISRTVLINLQRVSFAEREGLGTVAFVLESGARVLSSTRFRLESGARLRVARTRGTGGKSHFT